MCVCECFDAVREGSEQEGWRFGERDENSLFSSGLKRAT